MQTALETGAASPGASKGKLKPAAYNMDAIAVSTRMNSTMNGPVYSTSCRQLGVSLLELIIAILVAAVLAGVAMPSFFEASRNNRIAVAVDTLFAHLLKARNHAVTNSEAVIICARDGGQCAPEDSYDWSKGWLLVADLNDNEAPDPTEPVLAEFEPESDAMKITFRTGTARFRYRYNGIGTANGTFVLCDMSPPPKGRKVIVSNNGRPRLAQKNEERADCT
jgi:type IV fimbrial biogenesis protein FimT